MLFNQLFCTTCIAEQQQREQLHHAGFTTPTKLSDTYAPPFGTRTCPAGKKKKASQEQRQQQQVQQLTVSEAPDVSSVSTPSNGTTAPPLTTPQQTTPAAASAPAAAVAVAPGKSNWTNIVWKRVVRELSSLPRAIGIMAVITGLSALGTVIPQNKVNSEGPVCESGLFVCLNMFGPYCSKQHL